MPLSRFAPRAARLVLPIILLALALPGTANAASGVVSGAPAPSWQTNGTVYALAAANGAIYVGGNFTSVRPPDALPGTNEVPRNRLAAFDAATGDLLPFNPDLDNTVYALAASPDGSRVFAGGDFMSVGGVSVRRVAAFNTSTGAMITSWKPKPTSRVAALDASGDTLYMGGQFQSINSQPRVRLAAVDIATGALTPWAPSAGIDVQAISASKDGQKVYVGGRFDVLNGSPTNGIAALTPSPTVGTKLPFSAELAIPPETPACDSVVKDLTVDDTTLYVANEGEGGGCFDGTMAANISDGSLKWKNTCLGATQSVAVVGNFVYKGSHAHDCSSVPGGFGETGPGGKYHLQAQFPDTGLLGPWYPSTNGMPLGPRVMATDGSTLFVGGDFTYVNSRKQQGFTRFVTGPDTTKPIRPAAPLLSSINPGEVRVSIKATWDRDNNDLTYKLLRDGGIKPIVTWQLSSTPWSLPTAVGTDTGLEPGSTHTYKVLVTDGTNSERSLISAPIVVASTPVGYADRVRADLPFLYWRLGEASGNTAADASGNGRSGIYSGGNTKARPGALLNDSDTSVFFEGLLSGRVGAASSGAGPQTFTQEAWIKTTTTRGGKIIGFGDSQSGTSSNYDRHVYMTNSGQLVFGVWTGATQTITTPDEYNDDEWHHIAARLGPNGMALYVDGTLIGTNPTTSASNYNGYWRVGGDNLNGWPSRPTSNYFRGTIDEVAVFPYALTGTQIAERYASR